jgi:RPA family protein
VKVKQEDILKRIEALPVDFAEHVLWDEGGTAEVKSFTTDDDVYAVSIRPHKDDPGDKSLLDVTCACPARALCKHVVAFYAVAKGLDSTAKAKALKTIAEAQELSNKAFEKLTEGIVLYVREGQKEEEVVA